MTAPDSQLALGLDDAPHEGREEPIGEPAPHPPSPEQEAVIAFETDLVVSAGAGSGKTRTLVDLYARLIGEAGVVDPEPLAPSRILCLTFTDRAAREILERVRKRVDHPALLRDLESAPVTTFHAWCAKTLRDHPLEAGVDPRFTVLSEEAAEDLLRRSAVESLRRGLEGDRAARLAVETLGLSNAAGAVAGLVREIRTAGWSRGRPIERFEQRLAETVAALRGPLAAAVDETAGAYLEAAHRADLTDRGREYLVGYRSAVEAWRGERSPDAADRLEAAAKAPARSWKAPRFPEARDLRHALLEAIETWRAAKLEVDHAAEIGAWPALAVTVREAYAAARAARGALDYDDLLLRTRDLLRDHPETLRLYRRRYRVVLVDEHQDTDPVQHQILDLLLGPGALQGRPPGGAPRWGVVGDARQSIYGFRGATVTAFAALVRSAEERGAHRTLATNYRSRRELIEFHNAFFPPLLEAGPAEETLPWVEQSGWREPAGGPAVELLDPSGLDVPAAEGREIEARALAARLAAALDPDHAHRIHVHDPETGELRPAGPGDAVILMRRLTRVEPYRRALQAAGIDNVVVGSGGFWERQEVFDVLNALEAALASEDPVPLVGLLRSPMVGLPDDVVWRLVAGWRRGDWPLRTWIDRRERELGLERDVREILAEGRAVLDGIRARADRRPPGDVVAWLIDRTGYAAVLDALPDRGQRRANLERLLDLADRAPDEGLGLLADWVAALRARVEAPPRERDAVPPEGGDRLRILTIHQAKGLEFPIVALADLGGSVQGGPGAVAFDPDLGVVARRWADSAADPESTFSYRLAKERARSREAAEEARLLYVAATRARDRLILSSGSPTGGWAEATCAFAAAHEGRHVVVRPLEAWRERLAGALRADPPPPPEPRPRAEPLPAAPGEATARELAAAMAGDRSGPSAHPGARMAAVEALRRGNAAHAALERLPLHPRPGFDLRRYLERSDVDGSDLAPLTRLVERVVWPRLRGAREVWRERPFRLRLPGGGVVSGAIDCLWSDDSGRWRVWDWKVAGEDPRHEERHDAQLGIYALAAATALDLDEVTGCLWYVATGAARQRSWTRGDLDELEERLAEVFDRLPADPL